MKNLLLLCLVFTGSCIAQDTAVNSATHDHASAAEWFERNTVTVNKAAGNFSGLLYDYTLTSAPGTDNRLIDFIVDSTSVFRVNEDGQLTLVNGVMTGQSLAGSASNSVLDLATTWSTTGTPTALKLNVTDTASNASSLLMDLQVGGTSKFKVTKSGAVTVANIDVAGDVAVKNGTSAVEQTIYNTYTDASNYEGLEIGFKDTVNVATIKTTGSGTGAVTPRALRLESQGARFLHQTGATTNLFAGDRSGNYAVSGSNNTGAGYNTLASATSGVLNSAFGSGALDAETTGSYNTAVGGGSLGGQNGATYNTAVGRGAGLLLSTSSYNTIIGGLALDAETTGSYNTAVGWGVFTDQNGGNYNDGFGYNVGASISTGTNNAAFGSYSIDAETTGVGNSAFGYQVLTKQNGASGNAAFGRGSGSEVTTGSNNSLFGSYAGDNLTSGSSNIILGYNIDAQSATASGQISIGNLIFGTDVGTGTTASTGNVGIGVVAPANKLSVDGTIKSKTYTVATLPDAATVGAGATAFVSDGSVVHAGNSGTVVAGSGANFVPVYSDGTDWRIQ